MEVEKDIIEDVYIPFLVRNVLKREWDDFKKNTKETLFDSFLSAIERSRLTDEFVELMTEFVKAAIFQVDKKRQEV